MNYHHNNMDLKSVLGYSNGSPFIDNPYINIKGNSITMKNTSIPLMLQPMKEGRKIGETKIAKPFDKNPYKFPNADSVLEIPLMQEGGLSYDQAYDFLFGGDNDNQNEMVDNWSKDLDVQKRIDNFHIKNNNSIPIKADNKAQYAYNFFKSKGLKSHQAAGIVNNLIQESGNFRDDVINFSTTGDNNLKDKAYGIAQWRGKRKDSMLNFANQNNLNPYSLDTQLMFVEKEAKERGDWYKLLNTENVQDATHIFNYNYEVSADSRNPNLRNLRLKHMNKYKIWE